VFKLDMNAIREDANRSWLMANVANLANKSANEPKFVSQLAGLANSHDSNVNSHSMLASWLIAAAMKVCDRHNDGEAAREEMRQDVLGTPPHLQQDLLDHFTGKP
jgi:hypothetical protein